MRCLIRVLSLLFEQNSVSFAKSPLQGPPRSLLTTVAGTDAGRFSCVSTVLVRVNLLRAHASVCGNVAAHLIVTNLTLISDEPQTSSPKPALFSVPLLPIPEPHNPWDRAQEIPRNPITHTNTLYPQTQPKTSVPLSLSLPPSLPPSFKPPTPPPLHPLHPHPPDGLLISDDPNWWTHSLLHEGYGKDKHWVFLGLPSRDSA